MTFGETLSVELVSGGLWLIGFVFGGLAIGRALARYRARQDISTLRSERAAEDLAAVWQLGTEYLVAIDRRRAAEEKRDRQRAAFGDQVPRFEDDVRAATAECNSLRNRLWMSSRSASLWVERRPALDVWSYFSVAATEIENSDPSDEDNQVKLTATVERLRPVLQEAYSRALQGHGSTGDWVTTAFTGGVIGLVIGILLGATALTP